MRVTIVALAEVGRQSRLPPAVLLAMTWSECLRLWTPRMPFSSRTGTSTSFNRKPQPPPDPPLRQHGVKVI